jgi:hypothetical protein
LSFFRDFQEVHKVENEKITLKMEIENEEDYPKLVRGEKRRFMYLASKLLNNAILRGE